MLKCATCGSNTGFERLSTTMQLANYNSFKTELAEAVSYLNTKGDTLRYRKKHVLNVPDDKVIVVNFATTNYGKVKEFNAFLDQCQELKLITEGFIEFDCLPKERMIDVEETGTTFYENSALKSVGVSSAVLNDNKIILAEDSGLTVPGVDHEPGVYSARYFDRNVGSYDPEIFRAAVEVYQEILEKEPGSVGEKDGLDFMNKVMLVHRIMEQEKARRKNSMRDAITIAAASVGINVDSELQGKDCVRHNAFFQTVATIARAGSVMSHGIGTLHGEVVIRGDFQIGNKPFLRGLIGDFGYNKVFHVEDLNDKNLVSLSEVPLAERLKWNHRSIAMTRAVINFMLWLALD
jgi:inosine/xanthosine triphosphate pyrophosphatase family protein